MDYWHPGGMLYLVGNEGAFRVVTIEDQASHIREVHARVPGLRVEFVIDEVEHAVVHDGLIASVHVRYRMLLPEGYGKHRCYFNLACMNGKWGIVNAVDRGVEIPQA